MILHTIGSGSSGNCYLIENEGHFLALEAGCVWNKVMQACGYHISDIDACLVTHSHGDHAMYCSRFEGNGVPVYSNCETVDELNVRIRCKLRKNRQTSISGGYKVIPVSVPHEDVPNSAFIIDFPNGERMFYATDFEYIPVTLKTWNVNHFLIAVSRTDDIPEDASAREHRIRGHSTLAVVKEFLEKSITSDCKTVTACHLSGTYADPVLIQKELQELAGDHVKVSISETGKSINLSEVE